MHSNVIVFTHLSQCVGIYMCKSLHTEMRIYPWDPVSLQCKAQTQYIHQAVNNTNE